ncbi:MAG TPA: cytochrome C oxidase subunit III [Acetobacteraceae bacterium]|jgi:heme/copper-type cytochrome/quinol oxidase subunit 3|nr:cytochrome C oxidase subunit III [Acetobacteraceae bacterium]
MTYLGLRRPRPQAPSTPTLDVSALPRVAFGHRQPIWWGTIAYMVIEGTGFVMAVAAYFYLAGQNPDWPMAKPPSLIWGSLLLVFLLATEIPNFVVKKVAKRYDLRGVRILVSVMAGLGLVAIGIRALEFTTLNVRWDTNAYGSIVWALMFLHTMHIVTDVAETCVIAAMLFITPPDGRRFVDVDENAEYWDFVVLSWIPVYLVLYWAPRWLAP